MLVTRADGVKVRGSGYRVTSTTVLTAAHVVAGAARIEVRFEADRNGEWLAPASARWLDERTDVAVVSFAAPPRASVVAGTEFGRLADRYAVIDVHLLGFPRWKLRVGPDGGVWRDLHQAQGTVAVLSNRRGGALEITVDPPGEDPDPRASPWEGVSGAAVWAGPRIVGVVAEHHRREGLGRLTAARIDECLRRAGDRQQELAELLGIPADGSLVDVVPSPPGTLSRTGYLKQVREIAPRDGLRGRHAELAELTAFCAGVEPYVWWQAGPWAGKTALLATFVANPPAGVDVVSFFVTARLAAQSDSNAFTDALLEQLAALLGETLPTALTLVARDAHRRALLATAAAQARQAGRRLVLVVDGLDEDRGAAAGSGLASIACLLPKLTEDGLRVIVAGRPDPPTPDDVDPDHPLRTCRVRRLAVSPYARQTIQKARLELDELLTGSPAHRDVIGLVAACGGGISLGELAELTGQAHYELESMIGGVFGRTVSARSDTQRPDSQRVLLFAHETLQLEAANRLGPGVLREYRDRIHAWADTYRQRGWPRDTPVYLLLGYPRMLREQADLPRMVALATDSARHDRMLDLIGGSAAALAEIKAALEHFLRQDAPDLLAVARLAIRRDDLAARGRHIPVDLPAVWATLNHPARGEALAHSIPDAGRSREALARLTRAVAETGNLHRAEAIARSIPAAYAKAAALAEITKAAASARDWDLVGRLVREAADVARNEPHREGRAGALLAAAVAATATGDRDFAETAAANAIAGGAHPARVLTEMAKAVASAGDREWATALIREAEPAAAAFGRLDKMWSREVAKVSVAIGDHDRIEAIAGTLGSRHQGSDVRAELAAALAAGADHPRAHALRAALGIDSADSGPAGRADLSEFVIFVLARDREDVITSATGWPVSPAGPALVQAVQALATGDPDRAEAIARDISDPTERAAALTSLAARTVARDRDRALALATEAEATALAIFEPNRDAVHFTLLSRAVMAAGDFDLAEAIAGTITTRFFRTDVLAELVRRSAAAGDLDRAERIASTIADRGPEWWLSEAVAGLADAGDHDRAEALSHTITDPGQRVRSLATVAAKVAADRPEYARTVADRAEAMLDRLTDPHARTRGLISLAQAANAAGDHDRVAAMAREAMACTPQLHEWPRWYALAELAPLMAEIGEVDQAEAIARTLPRYDPDLQGSTVPALVRAVAAAGDLGRAEALARHSPIRFRGELAIAWVAAGEIDRAVALARRLAPSGAAAVAMAVAAAGDLRRAEEIIDTIAEADPQASALAEFAELVAPAHSRRILARAFAIGHWTAPIAGLARLTPSIALTIARERLAETGVQTVQSRRRYPWVPYP